MSKADITPEMIDSYHQLVQNDKTRLAMNAVTSNGFFSSAQIHRTGQQIPTEFDIEVDTKGITDQKRTGRCWLFATLNDLRYEAAKKLKIDDFKFSANYCYFWDLLEKANLFLEMSIRYAKRPLDDRLARTNDVRVEGGWSMFAANVINKYGLVPAEIMPETVPSNSSSATEIILEQVERKYGLELRRLAITSPDQAEQRKVEMLGDIYRILVIGLGEPPTKFSWSYRDKKKHYIEINDVTPLEFKNKVIKPVRYVTLLNNPALEFGKIYRYQNNSWWNNMIDKNNLAMLNLEFTKLEEIIVNQLRAGKPVQFGSLIKNIDTNIGDGKHNCMTTNSYDFNNLLDIDIKLDKATANTICDPIDHAMLITGATLDKQGKPVWWKVENSWGDKAGDKGYFTMSAEWLRRYGHDITVPKRDLSEWVLSQLKQKPIVRKPWQYL